MTGTFAVASLQNVETIFLNSELEVLHVSEMTLQIATDFHQFIVGGGHFSSQMRNRMRRAYACDHVFALGVDQIFAVKDLFAGRRVARECNTCGARFSIFPKTMVCTFTAVPHSARNPYFWR